jgi:ABC-type multidrug transport system fused ATPase/permease subunit
VLSNCSFRIKASRTTAIVGPSGMGKSTIVQLVQRFYDPTNPEGKLKFDQTDLKDIDLVALRDRIGYVSQEPVLIMGTVRENLLFGNADATEQDCFDALKAANANFVLEELEDGLDTYVGTQSVVNMSGGQKQRIAIARALIKKPCILILDEATSALDPKSENEV